MTEHDPRADPERDLLPYVIGAGVVVVALTLLYYGAHLNGNCMTELRSGLVSGGNELAHVCNFRPVGSYGIWVDFPSGEVRFYLQLLDRVISTS